MMEDGKVRDEHYPFHECPICGEDCDCDAGDDACKHNCREEDYDDRDD